MSKNGFERETGLLDRAITPGAGFGLSSAGRRRTGKQPSLPPPLFSDPARCLYNAV